MSNTNFFNDDWLELQ
nr:poly(3-hydroxybutyric acid) granule-associated 41 kda protein=phaECv product {N-terminal} [Chromatium vinosum, D, DSM 180, Peptide Partial, 15 aa] [Allochromatium vinosum]